MKERMITRTITSTNCSVLCYNLMNGEVKHIDFPVSGDLTKNTEKEVLDYIREHMETESVRVLKVDALVSVKKKYAISETDFLRYAHVMSKEEEEEEEADEEG